MKKINKKGLLLSAAFLATPFIVGTSAFADDDYVSIDETQQYDVFVNKTKNNEAIFFGDIMLYGPGKITGTSSELPGASYLPGDKILTIENVNSGTILTNIDGLKVKVIGNNSAPSILTSGSIEFIGDGVFACNREQEWTDDETALYRYCVASKGRQTYNGPTIKDVVHHLSYALFSENVIEVKAGEINTLNGGSIYATGELIVNGGVLNASSITLSGYGARFNAGEIHVGEGISTNSRYYPIILDEEQKASLTINGITHRACVEENYGDETKCAEYRFNYNLTKYYPGPRITLGGNMGLKENAQLTKNGQFTYDANGGVEYYVMRSSMMDANNNEIMELHFGSSYNNTDIMNTVSYNNPQMNIEWWGYGGLLTVNDTNEEIYASHLSGVSSTIHFNGEENYSSLNKYIHSNWLGYAIEKTSSGTLITQIYTYDISVYSEGNEITEVDGGFQLSVPIPDAAVGFDKLYFVNYDAESGTVDTEHPVSVVVHDGVLTATLPHLSVWVLAGEYAEPESNNNEEGSGSENNADIPETSAPDENTKTKTKAPNSGISIGENGSAAALMIMTIAAPVVLIMAYVTRGVKKRSNRKIKF